MRPEIAVVANIKAFDKKFPKCPKDSERRKSLEKYFAIGGVIKAYKSETEWPKLTYPSSVVLDSKISEVHEKKKFLEEKLKGWKKAHSAASNYHQVNDLLKLKEPLYWKHVAKMVADSDYRKDAEAVKLPAHLVGDKKWQPMVKMFVNDLDYRKQLSETVRTSIVYKKDKKVAKYADQLQDFRMETSGKQIKDIEDKVADYDATDKALREMQKWARE